MQNQETNEILESHERIISSLERQLSFFSNLIEWSVILTSTLDLDELIHKVLALSQKAMRCEASNVMLLNEKTGQLKCRAALGTVGQQLEEDFTLEMGQGIAGWVAENRTGVVVTDVSKDERFYRGVDSRTGFITRSILCAPLIVQDKLLGVSQVINPVDGKKFNEEDLKLFETFCRGVAVSVQNSQMHRRLLNNHRVEQQLEMASIIQQGFLPRSFDLKSGGKFEIAAVNLPASMVGGDLYDCFQLRPDLFALTIGDVSGKGVPAALYMARLLSDFRSRVFNQLEDLVGTMQTLNEELTERSRQGMFVTMIYLNIDVSRGLLRYVNGGHIPPMLFRKPGKKIDRLDAGEGIPLGIMKTAVYEEACLKLEAGDTVVLFSDGVLDAKNSKGETFTIKKIQKVIRGKWDTADELISAFVQALKKHMGEENQFDDITVVVLRWC
ncbi:MAG: GAF domain-containing SpoIIE family protein phosphatase [Gemmatimonadota bacterium]|nr:GAF domain-containing SpoIIE family protein phosphatase [Gemmatimonadota bacterium]